MSYTLPQVLVFQQFRQISSAVVGNLNACIIGPNYYLARYNEASEKELTRLGKTYIGDAIKDEPYPNGIKGVDTNYVKVFFENPAIEYAAFDTVDFVSDDKSIIILCGDIYEVDVNTAGISGPAVVDVFSPDPDHTIKYAEYVEHKTTGPTSASAKFLNTSGCDLPAGGTILPQVYVYAYTADFGNIISVDGSTASFTLASGTAQFSQNDQVTLYNKRTKKTVGIVTITNIDVTNEQTSITISSEHSISEKVAVGDPVIIRSQQHVGTPGLATFTTTKQHSVDADVKVGDTFTHSVSETTIINMVGSLVYGSVNKNKVIGFIPAFERPNEFNGAAISNLVLCRNVVDVLQIPKLNDNEPADPNWTADEDTISFAAGIRAPIKLEDGTVKWKRIATGTPYVELRALNTKYSETIHEVDNTTDVRETLGGISIDNPLAQGCYHAILNSGDRPVFFIAVQSDDLAGYEKAFKQLEKSSSVYSLVPMTDNDEVLDSLKAHVTSMSGAESKKWRIGVVGISTAQTVPIYNKAHHPMPGRVYNAQVTVFDNNTDKAEVVFSSLDYTNAHGDLRVGDKLWYKFDDEGKPGVICTITQILTNDRVFVESLKDIEVPDTDLVNQPMTGKVEVWRNLTPAEWADYVASKASSFASRRMYVIFPEVLWNAGKEYPAYIGAAAIAGLISSVPPQQGLTRIELNGFDDIPMVYSDSGYTREQLNKIAEHGGLIIAQDEPGGKVYVRHQVSTASLENNPLTRELSVTKDVDAISYYLADVLDPFVGKYNITPVLLEQVRTTITGALNYLGSYNTGAGLLGPMLLADSENTKIIGIAQHETFKDHLIVSLMLDIPLPCNVIELYLSI